jgi:hypothetical protein
MDSSELSLVRPSRVGAMRTAAANDNPRPISAGGFGSNSDVCHFPDLDVLCVPIVPQPIGVLFIMTQQVQPAAIMTLMHSQHP